MHSHAVFHGLRGWPGWVYRASKMMIVMTNTKGGVGKSTLAAHLAIWLFDQGRKVALLDTDEQATASGWIERAEKGITVAKATTVDAIRREMKKLRSTHEFIVADSPGSGGEAAQAITLLADIALIPLQPSKPDLRAVKDALKFVRLAQEMTGGTRPKATIVLTFTAKGDVQTRRLRHDLSEIGVPIAKSEIRRLNAFRDACDSSVTRMPEREAGEAARDVDQLFRELFAEHLAAQPIDKEVMNG